MHAVLVELEGKLSTAMTTNITSYYIGKVKFPPLNYLPALCIYGESTSLVSDKLGTSRDKWLYTIKIEVMVNPYNYVKEAGVVDKILKLQKATRDLIEDRDSSGTPKNATVLGVLRDNMIGTSYLFNNNIDVDYTEELEDGSYYYKGTVTVEAITKYAPR